MDWEVTSSRQHLKDETRATGQYQTDNWIVEYTSSHICFKPSRYEAAVMLFDMHAPGLGFPICCWWRAVISCRVIIPLACVGALETWAVPRERIGGGGKCLPNKGLIPTCPATTGFLSLTHTVLISFSNLKIGDTACTPSCALSVPPTIYLFFWWYCWLEVKWEQQSLEALH